MKYKYVIFTCMFFLNTQFCQANDVVHDEICKKIIKSKKPVAVLMSEDGSIAPKGLDIGRLDPTNGRRHNDYLLSDKKYRLITYPRKFGFKENLSQGFIIQQQKVKPICKKTTEVLLSVGVLPRAFGAGPFKIMEPFFVDEFNADFDNQFEIDYQFNNVIYGFLP